MASASVRKRGQFGLARVGAGEDHLQRDGAAELRLPRLVDDPHAAATQFAQNLVAQRRQDRAACAGRGTHIGGGNCLNFQRGRQGHRRSNHIAQRSRRFGHGTFSDQERTIVRLIVPHDQPTRQQKGSAAR